MCMVFYHAMFTMGYMFELKTAQDMFWFYYDVRYVLNPQPLQPKAEYSDFAGGSGGNCRFLFHDTRCSHCFWYSSPSGSLRAGLLFP